MFRDPQARIVRDRVTLVFQSLRANGFVCYQDYRTSQTEAITGICAWVGGMTDVQRLAVRGGVYYTKEDGEALRQKPMYPLHIRYGQVEVAMPAPLPPYKSSLQPEQVGHVVRAALVQAGLVVEWDEDPGRSIQVLGTVEEEKRLEEEEARGESEELPPTVPEQLP